MFISAWNPPLNNSVLSVRLKVAVLVSGGVAAGALLATEGKRLRRKSLIAEGCLRVANAW
jgi:hypothetical protein